MSTSVLDFIPASEHAGIKARTSTTDVASYFAAAIADIDSNGGGELYIPAGRYRCGSPIVLCNQLRVRGDSRHGTLVQFTQAGTDVASGSGFCSIWPSNASNSAYITVSDLAIEMIHASNQGAAFWDNCGTYITLRDCVFSYGKYGVVFDQTEVSGIYTCSFGAQTGAGLWLVTGGDVTPGNLGGFTNQISVDHNCQFDEGGTAYAVVDDGGDSHLFGNNNYNGGGLRFAGVGNLTVIGGEYEAVNPRPTMTFSHLTLAGDGVGRCGFVTVMNAMIVQPGAFPCMVIFSGGSFIFLNNTLNCRHSGVAACIEGVTNASSVFARHNVNYASAVPLFNDVASGPHDIGVMAVLSTAATAYALTPSATNALLQTTSGSPVAIAVPTHATIGYSIGTRVLIEQNGAGAVTVAGAAGVTLNGTLTTTAQYQRRELIKTATNRWLVTRQS